jgi:hypothetical protein
MIKYISLFFLLVIFAVFFVGCQTFTPSNEGVAERNRVGFFESAKRLLMPDFDNENVDADLQVAKRKAEHSKQPASKSAANYAFGNSLSANPQQNIIYQHQPQPQSFYPYPPNHINTNFYPQQNNFLTKNTPAIIPDTNQNQTQTQNSKSNESSGVVDQIVQSNNVDEKKSETASDLISSNNSAPKVESDLAHKTTQESKANKTVKIKKCDVDPLLPQRGDSENFRLFLNELAEIPADKLKVDETELIERIEAFRVECAAVNSSKFEAVSLGNLRHDVLPDFLTDKKIKNKNNSDSATQSVLTSSKKNDKSTRKLDIEQTSYSEKHGKYSDDIYCNDNYNGKNAPLPVDVQPDGKKQRLSPIQSRGFESVNQRNPATAQSLPVLPQLTNSQPASFSYNNSPIETPNATRFDKGTHDNKFVSYSPNQSGNIITANYLPQNQNTFYPANAQQQFSNQNDNWEMQVRNAIMLLRREMEMSSGVRTFSNEVKLRLLELSVGNRGEAIKPFGAAEKQVNEFWADQMLGLSTIMDEMIIPNRFIRYDSALLRFDNSVAALRQVCPLRLKNVQLIQHDSASHISSFGNFQTRNEDCKPSETILIYLELENPTIKKSSQGYTVRVSVVCDVLDTASNVVQKDDQGNVEDISTAQKRDHFIKMELTLKKNLPNGYYKLRIRVTDLNSHDSQKTAEEQIPIRIIR